VVFGGDLDGRFSAPKKAAPFENISVDFPMTLWWANRGGRSGAEGWVTDWRR
jgi:hypothetical protein